MADDAQAALRQMVKGLRSVPKLADARAKEAAKVAEAEGKARAPRRTGRLAASFRVRSLPERSQIVAEFPGEYQPIASGVPSRGIPPHDFADRAIEKAEDEQIKVLDDIIAATLGGR